MDLLLEDVEKQSKKEPLKACRPISSEENAVLIKYFKLLLKINEKVGAMYPPHLVFFFFFGSTTPRAPPQTPVNDNKALNAKT